jgi:hypothetical protein
MSKSKAMEYFALDKENFESYLIDGTVISNEEWQRVVDEIDGRVANYLDELLPMIVQEFEEGEYDD